MLVGFLAVAALIAIAVWWYAVLNPPWPLIFASFWTVIVIGIAYRDLFRASIELSSDNEHVEWKGVFLHGRTSLWGLRRIRPSRFDPYRYQVIERANGRSVLVWTPLPISRGNFRSFSRALQERNPGIKVQLGWWERLSHALPRCWTVASQLWRR